ncbi:MAG: S1C family serine protease [Planctomycetia bacterium]|nr:S1C family serine protease [Planctomycetia bacterium]
MLWALITGMVVEFAQNSLFAQTRSKESENDISAMEQDRRGSFVRAVAKASGSVVSIQGEKQYEAAELQKNGETLQNIGQARENITHIGMGTGVIIDERGYIITNYHVVKGLHKIQITTNDGTVYRDVEFIRNDLATDLALLKIDPIAPLARISFGESKKVFLAEEVVAIGNPFGYQASVSRGIVSGLNRPLKASDTLYYENVIQTDAAINPGNSGGPLINVDGEMIGLNAAVREGAENIAFAIPSDIVSEIADRMIRDTVARINHHGLKLERVSKKLESDKKRSDQIHCAVLSVDPKSPAALAGIKKGDIIISSNHYSVRTPLDFTCSLIGVKLLDEIEISVFRDGRELGTSLAFGRAIDKSDEMTVLASRPISSPVNAAFEAAGVSPSYGLPANEKETTLYRTADQRKIKSGASSSEYPVLREEEKIIFSQKDLKKSDSKSDYLWKEFGIRIAPVSREEYQRIYPDLMVISMGKFKIYPAGGVRVDEVADSSVFHAQKEKLQKGDLIFGFVVGDSEENRWGVTSLDDLSYIVEQWKELASDPKNKSGRVYLIRNATAYFLDISL